MSQMLIDTPPWQYKGRPARVKTTFLGSMKQLEETTPEAKCVGKAILDHASSFHRNNKDSRRDEQA